MQINNFDTNWEDKIYNKGLQINEYPYGELVSIFFQSMKLIPKEKPNNEIKILELGCGAGNNLWFLSELGYDVYGIDGSVSACKIAKEKMHKRNVNVNIQNAYFDKLPFENESIDIIIDRTATYCGKLSTIKSWWNEANRILKRGGMVISFMFSDNSPHLKRIKNKEYKADKVEHNTYTNINKGTFRNTGLIHFTKYSEIDEIFHFLDIKFINLHEGNIMKKNIEYEYGTSEWIIVGTKKNI